MSKRKSVKVSVHLTERSLQDLVGIEEYSIANWGKRVANRYLGNIEAALQRISDNSEILQEEPNFHNKLFFYRVNKHLLVCDIQKDSIFFLTVLHGHMDVSERLAELEPTLKVEVAMLHEQLERNKKAKP